MEKFRKNGKIIFLLGLCGLTAAVWYAVFYFESRQNLLITFFDVGQGDSIFIEVPNGHQILIDGGPNNRVLAKLGRTMPFWDRSVDLLILTHPHADHLAGLLEVLQRYDIGMVVETEVNHSIPEYEEWNRLLKEKRVKVYVAEAGQQIRLGETTYLDILAPLQSFAGQSPKNIHDSMIVSRLVHGSTTVLLMGDAEKQIEYKLLYSGKNLDSDVLKVGHHGSKTSSVNEFLHAVSPEIAVIQVGRQNRYGHPAQEVLDRLAGIGAKILRNDLNGDIIIESDGYSIKVK